MFLVESCPKNRTAVGEATTRLGCGFDKYGNSQYMCIPNVEKSSLVEFCYDTVMGIVPSGNCMQVFQGNVTLESCTDFPLGCPQTNFWKDEFYKYPACQLIDKKCRCYILDPSCLREDCWNNNDVEHAVNAYSYVLGVLLALAIIGLIGIAIKWWSRRKQKKKKTTLKYIHSGGLAIKSRKL